MVAVELDILGWDSTSAEHWVAVGRSSRTAGEDSLVVATGLVGVDSNRAVAAIDLADSGRIPVSGIDPSPAAAEL